MAAKELIDSDLQVPGEEFSPSDETYEAYWDLILDLLVEDDGQEN